MRLALFGYGKMGREIEKIAHNRNHQTSQKKELTTLDDVDLCIDFSHPTAVIDHLQWAAESHTNVLIGTTGWEQQLPQAKEIAEKQNIGLLYSPNFSIGVQLFVSIAQQAAEKLKPFGYDLAIRETHHNEKQDAPSGTALWLSEATNNKNHIASSRCGRNPGQHEVIFDSPQDTITLMHQAHSRQGFALGAVLAAEWLQGKSGFFTIDDMIKELT